MPFVTQTVSPFVAIRILHTNDIHGHILPEPDLKSGVTPPALFGGAASLATAMKRYRREAVFGRPADVLFYFDAGDFFQGAPEGTLTRGTAMIELFDQLGLDFQAVGNHEFDFGVDTFKRLADAAAWPMIALNIEEETGAGALGLSKTILMDFKKLDLRIAVIGWITDEMASLTTAEGRRGLTFHSALETAHRAANAVRDTTALIIAVSHAGLHEDTVIANADTRIHVIVGGHSHTALSPYYKSDSTGAIVVQAGSHLRDLGVLDLLYNTKTHKIVRANSRLIPLYESEFPPDPAVRRWAQGVAQKVGKLLDEQVAVSAEDYLKESDTECVPGNLMTDAMRWATGADAAFQNSYGIRADLAKGPITLRTLFTMMPFDNTIVSMTLTGEQILDLLEQSASLERGFLQMSGVRMIADVSRPAGERVVFAQVGGADLQSNRSYRIATNSFLAEGGDHFDVFPNGTDRKDSGRNMRDAIRDYLRHLTGSPQGVYQGRLEGRIQVLGAPPTRAR